MLNKVKKAKKDAKYSMILNLDLNKAYDRVRWDFIREVLTSIGFPAKWIHIIMECVSSVTYSVLVNGEPARLITPKVVLRQGDPQSPYLFILCMEMLSRRITHQQRQGLINGLKAHRKASKIAHLLFADDALFFIKRSLDNVWNLQNILSTFCFMSGEIINTQKSYTVFSRNTPKKFIRLLNKGQKLGNKEKLGKYLGCPMDVTGHSLHVFEELLQKNSNTITSWSFTSLSQLGKLLLINSILMAYATHIMATFMFPKKMLPHSTSILLKFWWRTKKDKKPIYWRKRSLLEKHKLEGGLGLRNLLAINKATLFRQVWRMHHNPQLLASQMFRAKYFDS